MKYYIAFLYFLFDRTVGAYIFHSELVVPVYVAFSQIFTVVVLLQYLSLLSKYSLNKLNLKLLLAVLIIIISLFISNLINYESFYYLGQQIYPMIGMGSLICIYCSSIDSLKIFIKTIANVYFAMALVHFMFLIFAPHFFGTISSTNEGELYFLGIENQVGYPLLMGLFFNLLEYYFTKNRKRIIIYALMHILCSFIVFSGTTISSVVVLYILLLPNPISIIIKKLSLKRILICATILFVFIFFMFNLEQILQSSVISQIIEDGLHKNTTLSSRTLIWDIVIKAFWASPFWGYGVGETINIFFLNGGYLSAHNTILQYLFWGGIMFFISIIPMVYMVSFLLEKVEPSFASIFKCTIFSMLIAFMGEAVSFFFVIIIMLIGGVASNTLVNNKSQK